MPTYTNRPSESKPPSELAREIASDRNWAQRDEAAGYRGDRVVIDDGFGHFEDELLCIRTILRTPPIPYRHLIVDAGHEHVWPLLAQQAISTAYAEQRLDRALVASDLFATTEAHRAVDAILSGPRGRE